MESSTRGKKILIATSILIVGVYLIFGFFFLELPHQNPDENWDVSRMDNLIKYHRLDEPLFTKDVSPFFAQYYNATPFNQLLGSLKNGGMLITYLLLPLNENQAIRLACFICSVLLCFITYSLGRGFGLNKITSFISVVLMIITPEFFLQIHSERGEIMLAFSFALFFLFLNRILAYTNERRKLLCLIILGLVSWLPAITIHPSGLFIPPALGIIYLLKNRKNIISANTIIFGISMLPGFILLSYAFHEITQKALASGGGNYFETQGPALLMRGTLYIIKLPLLFYNNFIYIDSYGKPVSFLWTMLCFAGFFYCYKRKNKLMNFLPIILAAIISSLFFTYLISGSYGAYNIIIIPFLSVVAGFWVDKIFLHDINEAKTVPVIIFCVFMLAIFGSNFFNIKNEMRYVSEYKKLRTELHNTIPPNVSVLGSVLYYTTFKEQPFYHTTWFDPNAGIPNQSFEEGVKALKIQYIIVDDILLGKALSSKRDKKWISDMLKYLDEKCTPLKIFQTYYYVSSRVPDPKIYPVTWKYKGMKKNFLQKVSVYKVNELS